MSVSPQLVDIFDFRTILLAFISFLLIYHAVRRYVLPSQSKHYNLPPGPRGWPLLGNLPSMDPVAPYKSLNRFEEKYGSVFRLYFGSHLVVVLNDYEAVREAFIKHGDTYIDRPKKFLQVQMSKGKGKLYHGTGTE